jgi:SM-20-related protein
MPLSIDNSVLFESIAKDIVDKGYSISLNALPNDLSTLLSQHINALPKEDFQRAGIGRGNDYTIDGFIRTDEVSWITNKSEAGCEWIKWIATLQSFLNRHLFLGLYSFESHFSHYAKGDFYKKHKDAFNGEGNRVLSVVVYLNENWSLTDGGELVIYNEQWRGSDIGQATVTPSLGTIVVFLSEEFPHEVLPAKCDRYSIAGWFRLNNTDGNTIERFN